MLTELLDVMVDLAETCAPCSGGEPAPPTWPGAGGSGGGYLPPPQQEPPRDPHDYDPRQQERPQQEPAQQERPERDRPFHERPGHKGRLQRDKVRETIANLAWEAATSGAGNLGSVTGPAITVALASDTLADGVSTVMEADRIREDRISEQTGGHFDNGAGERVAEPTPRDRPNREQRRRERDPYVERVMEDIEIKREIEDAGNKGWDGWKDWK